MATAGNRIRHQGTGEKSRASTPADFAPGNAAYRKPVTVGRLVLQRFHSYGLVLRLYLSVTWPAAAKPECSPAHLPGICSPGGCRLLYRVHRKSLPGKVAA